MIDVILLCHPVYSQDKDKENAQNHYNHNFSGLYCTCNQKYPDAENQVPFFSCLNSSKTFCLRRLSVSSVLLSKHYLPGSGWDDSVCHLWGLVPQQSEHLFTSFNWLCSESHTSLTHFLSQHLGCPVEDPEDLQEMVCEACMNRAPFLWTYAAHFAGNPFSSAVRGLTSTFMTTKHHISSLQRPLGSESVPLRRRRLML